MNTPFDFMNTPYLYMNACFLKTGVVRFCDLKCRHAARGIAAEPPKRLRSAPLVRGQARR
jgi:hypothetical protein